MTRTASARVIDLPARGGIPLSELTSTLYHDPRRTACRHLSAERRTHTLQATARVLEAYLKLARERQPRFADVHLLAVLSRVMRQMLVSYASSRTTQKRQAQISNVFGPTIVEINGHTGPDLVDLIALDDALRPLADTDERVSRLIEMRYFGGMTAQESADALAICAHVVRHELRLAEACLRRRLRL